MQDGFSPRKNELHGGLYASTVVVFLTDTRRYATHE